MIELFAVMYMFYTMSLSDPGAPESDIPKLFPQEIVTQFEESRPPKEQPHDTDSEAIDYLKELKKLGYYKETTKDKDLNIIMAIVHFQSDSNLNITGVWNVQSLSALKKRLEEEKLTYPDTVDTPPASGKWIAINKTKRILTLYEGSKVSRKYPIAVGNPSSLTPSGKYTIVCKIVNPAWGGGGYAQPVAGGIPQNPLGYRWMGLSLGGGDRYGIHGNNNPYSIGTYASHGCIRMANADVESLFEIIDLKTPVWMGDETELNKWGVRQPEFLYGD